MQEVQNNCRSEFLFEKDGLVLFNITSQGEDHKAGNIPCQDSSDFEWISPFLIAAAADGVGSCKNSHLGAGTAVRAAMNFVKKALTDGKPVHLMSDDQAAGKLLYGAFEAAWQAVEDLAVRQEMDVESLLSTLTLAIYAHGNLLFGHAGDDGLVAVRRNGSYLLCTTRHKGEEASSVYPLQARFCWQFGKVDQVTAFVLATDGILDLFVRPAYEGNRIYYPFIKNVYEADYRRKEDAAAQQERLNKLLNDSRFLSRVGDDLTFLMAVDLHQRQQAEKPRFSMEEWNLETSRFNECRRQALITGTEKSGLNGESGAGHDL